METNEGTLNGHNHEEDDEDEQMVNIGDVRGINLEIDIFRDICIGENLLPLYIIGMDKDGTTTVIKNDDVEWETVVESMEGHIQTLREEIETAKTKPIFKAPQGEA